MTESKDAPRGWRKLSLLAYPPGSMQARGIALLYALLAVGVLYSLKSIG
jgi:hypothetical protein